MGKNNVYNAVNPFFICNALSLNFFVYLKCKQSV